MNNKLKSSGLSESTLIKIQRVFCENEKIKVVLLYGSRAKGNFRNGSDIDLTIKDSDITFSDLLEIETQLDDLMTPYMFDISIFENIENQELVDHIKRNGVEFYKHL